MQRVYRFFAGIVVCLPLLFLPTVAPAADSAVEKGQAVHAGVGKIVRIDAAAGKAHIAHEPIASLNWPAMAMDFDVSDKAGLAKLKPGAEVEFRFVIRGRGQYIITDIKPRQPASEQKAR